MSYALRSLALLSFAVVPAALSAPSAADNGVNVPPGATRANGDGVEVDHLDPRSGRSGRIEPRWCPIGPDGTVSDVSTKVSIPDSVKASVRGLDANDTVCADKCNSLDVTGDGGTVDLGPGSRATITNTAAKDGESIEVKKPDGSSILVAPGTSQTITTPN